MSSNFPADKQNANKGKAEVRDITEKARGFLKMGHTRDAARELLNGLRRHPDNPSILCDVARVRIREGYFDEAKKILLQVIESNPENAKSRVILGQIELDSRNEDGDVTKAEEYFIEALVHMPEFKGAINGLFRLAKMHRHKGKLDKAKKLLEQITALNSKDRFALAYLGEVQLELGEFDEAIGTAELILYADEEDKYGFNLMGKAYSEKKDYNNAKIWYSKALDVDPDNPIAGTGIAQAFMEEGDLRGALAFAQAVINRDPRNMIASDLKQEIEERMRNAKSDKEKAEEAA